MKSKLLIIGLLFSTCAVFAQVPDTETFCLSDVTSQINLPGGGHPTCLSESFTYADGGCFNSYYNGKLSPYPQGSMLSFRNYGCYNPTVTTQAATNITETTATVNGNVTNTGRPAVTATGVCYSTTSVTPTIYDSYVNGSGVSGAFTGSMTGLTGGTTYFFRAFADNGRTVVYGDTRYFDTNAPACSQLATISTVSMSSSSSTGAQAEVNLSSHGTGCTVTEMGMAYGTSANPTITGSHTATPDVATGAYSWGITGLTAGTTYHYRAYATNSYGTAYGADNTYCQYCAPGVATSSATSVSNTSATFNGNAYTDNGYSITERGFCWSTTNSSPTKSDNYVTVGSGTGTFNSNATSLSPSTTYYYAAYATNSVGTTYASSSNFTTPCRPTTNVDVVVCEVVDNQMVTAQNLQASYNYVSANGVDGTCSNGQGEIVDAGSTTDYELFKYYNQPTWCDKWADGYYVMRTNAAVWGIQVTSGVAHVIYGSVH